MDVNSSYKLIYSKISKEWFNLSFTLNEPSFYRFFCLWNSFNALYILIGDLYTRDSERQKILIGQLNKDDANKIIESAKNLIRDPIRDLKGELFKLNQPPDVENFDYTKLTYERDYTNLEKLEHIVTILYRIRNNLTHGSKKITGMNIEIVNKANLVLKIIVGKCIEEKLPKLDNENSNNYNGDK